MSSLVLVKKPKKLEIFIDPQDLNRALLRARYPLSTIKDVATRLRKAKVFSVLDAKNGFWQFQLDKPSSLLTTFNTPLAGVVGFAYRLESKQPRKGTSEESMKAYKVSKV